MKQSPLRPCYLDVLAREVPASCSEVSEDEFSHRDDGQDFPRVHSALRVLTPGPSTNQGRREGFRTRNLIVVASPFWCSKNSRAQVGGDCLDLFIRRYRAGKIARIKRKRVCEKEREREEGREISNSREKTDRAKRAVAINLAHPPRRWRL